MKTAAALVLLISAITATQLCAQAAHSPAESGKPANKPEKTATKKEEKSGADNFLGPANAVNPNEPTTTEIYSDEAFFDSNKSTGVFSGRVKVTDPRFNLQSDKLTVYITKGESQGLERAIAEGNVAVVRDRPDPNGRRTTVSTDWRPCPRPLRSGPSRSGCRAAP